MKIIQNQWKSMKIVGQLQFTYKINENHRKSPKINESQWKLQANYSSPTKSQQLGQQQPPRTQSNSVVVIVVVVMVVVVETCFTTKQSCLSSWNWTSQQLKCQNSNKTIQNAKTCQQGFKNDIHTHGSCVFEEPHQLKTNLATTHSCPETERLAPGIAHGLRIRIAQTASQVTLKLHWVFLVWAPSCNVEQLTVVAKDCCWLFKSPPPHAITCLHHIQRSIVWHRLH